MMLHSTLQLLISIQLLLFTAFLTIAVDAFSFSAGSEIRLSASHIPRSFPILHLFGREESGKKKENYYLIEEDDVASNRDRRIARAGIVKRRIKKLKTPRPKQSDETKRKNRKYLNKENARKQTTYAIACRWRRFRQKIRFLIKRNTVYVLQCENDKYYVGSTRNAKERYRQHFESKRGGSKWTRMHRPIKIIAEYKRVPNRYLMGMESQKTAEYMMKHGVNNVRGAGYCYVRDYTTNDASNLTGFLGHHNQLDYQDLYQELKKTLPKPDPPSSFAIPPAKKIFRDKFDGDEDDENDEMETARAVKRQSSRSKRKNRKRKRARRYNQRKNNSIASDSPMDYNTDSRIPFNNRMEIPPRPSRVTKKTSNPIVDKASIEKVEDLFKEAENAEGRKKVMKITFEEKDFDS